MTEDAEKPVRLEMLAGTADACGTDACSTAEQGGEPACFANLVCRECGWVTTEGHAAGCAAVQDA